MVEYLAGNRLSGVSSERTNVSIADTTTTSGYTILSFTKDNQFTPTSAYSVEYLVVGGGGAGGGSYGGGGGAGGFKTGTVTLTANQMYGMRIGLGATGERYGSSSSYPTTWSDISGMNGTKTYFQVGHSTTNISTAGGGGGGRNYYSDAQNGASGGGGSVYSNGGGSSNDGGNNGGTGISGGGVTNWTAGGGGGQGGSGGTGTTSTGHSGNGGAGATSSITGTSKYYAAGGGAAGDFDACTGLGGSSIGGQGGGGRSNRIKNTYMHAVANTGSGGGGGHIRNGGQGYCNTGVVGGTATDDSSSGGSAGCLVGGKQYMYATGAGSDGIIILKFVTSGNGYTLGSDVTLLDKLQDGSIFFETDTKKSYVLEGTTWSEL